MSAFLPQGTSSIHSTSLGVLSYGIHRTQRKTRNNVCNVCNVYLWVHHIPSSDSNNGLFGWFVRNPASEQRQIAASQFTCFARCFISRRSHHTTALLTQPTQNFSLPNMGFALSFLRDPQKKEGDDNHLLLKTITMHHML